MDDVYAVSGLIVGCVALLLINVYRASVTRKQLREDRMRMLHDHVQAKQEDIAPKPRRRSARSRATSISARKRK
jgi:hypothetical protein